MRLYLCQHLLIFNDVLVCGEQHVELAAAQDGNKCSASSWRPLGKNRNAFNFLTQVQRLAKSFNFHSIFLHDKKRTTVQGDATDLVGDFHNRWRPLIKLIDPI